MQRDSLTFQIAWIGRQDSPQFPFPRLADLGTWEQATEAPGSAFLHPRKHSCPITACAQNCRVDVGQGQTSPPSSPNLGWCTQNPPLCEAFGERMGDPSLRNRWRRRSAPCEADCTAVKERAESHEVPARYLASRSISCCSALYRNAGLSGLFLP